MRRASTSSRITACALMVAGLLAAAAPGHAYRMIQQFNAGRQIGGSLVECGNASGFAHWDIRNISWLHNLAGQGAGKAAALQGAMASWTGVANANHVLTYAGTTGAGFVTDSLNTLVWGTDANCTGNCLALTAIVLQPGQVIVESDVIFNSAQPWTTNGSNFDTQAVAAHELGHTLGIHHTDDLLSPTPTMKTPYFGSGGRSLEWDDWYALQCAEQANTPNKVYGCQWSAGIQESNGTNYICPSGKVLSGRRHSGDENGTTYYLCCSAGNPQATATNCSWSAYLKESSNIQFVCPANQYVAGRQHTGDENGNTRYYCCNLNQNGVQIPRSGNCAWSTGQQESNSHFQCIPDGKVLVGRQHSGDENGTTWNYCCNPQW